MVLAAGLLLGWTRTEDAAGAAATAVPTATAAAPAADKGLADRRRRHARPMAERVGLLPAHLLRLPFKAIDYPLEHFVIHRDPGPVTVYARRFLSGADQLGFSLRVGGLGTGSGLGGGAVFTAPARLVPFATLSFSASTTRLGYDRYAAGLDSLRWGRLEAAIRFQYDERPQEDFFGKGPRSRLADRATYQLDELRGEVEARLRLRGAWRLLVTAGAARDDVGRGRDGDFPTVLEVFDPQQVEGLTGRFEFAEYGTVLVWDRRDVPTYARRGALFAARVLAAEGVGGTGHAYTKYDLEGQGFVPLPGTRKSLAARLHATITDRRAGRDVPVFRLERVGGSRTVRGYQTHRFTDRDALFGNLEYRFPIWTIEPPSGQVLDGALFFDWGTAVPDLERVRQRDLRSSAGLGFRLAAPRGLLCRFDNAWTPEGFRLHASLRGTF
jgi:hypothetical protein